MRTVGSMALLVAVLVCAALVEQTAASQANIGAVSAYIDPTTALQQLSIASIESGHATAAGTSVAVQEAYLKNIVGNTTGPGKQSVGYGQWPWNPERLPPGNLTASTESIVNAFGQLPQCQVTVQVSSTWNTSSPGLVSAVVILVYQNWGTDTIPIPWRTTIMKKAFKSVVNSWNFDVRVAANGVVEGSVNVEWADVTANGTQSVPIGFVVQGQSGDSLVPSAIFLNGEKCILLDVGGQALSLGDGVGGNAGKESAEQPLSLSGPNIIGTDGNVVNFHGLNWFGFEDGATMLEGMWANGDAMHRDLATMTQRIRLLGFNAIRLPFSMKDLFNLAPKSCKQPCAFPSTKQLLKSVTHPTSGRQLLAALGTSSSCQDVPPQPPVYTCAQQASFGKCSQSWMKGYCLKTCGTDVPPPPAKYTCAQQASFGKCKQPWMQGYCLRSCGTDVPPPPARYSCAQQATFGQCKQPWMQGYCMKSCGTCGTSSPSNSKKTPPPASSPTPQASGLIPDSRQNGLMRMRCIAGRINVQLPAPPQGGPAGVCNGYVPSDSLFNRFIYVVQFFARNGFYIILDNQLNFDTSVLDNQAGWVKGWQRVATAVNADPITAHRIMYDILNEPDSFNIGWQPANGRPGYGNLLTLAMDAIYAINPASIFVIEGTGQQNAGNVNWGDGVLTDISVIKAKGLSDPNPFFRRLLSKPYRRQVIVGVHLYGPSISKAQSKYSASNGLYQRLSATIAYLNKQGYCYKGDCQVFPVMWGEFGSRMEDPRDLQLFHDLVPYMKNKGAGADGEHNAISSWFWWCYPSNGGDTGGIVGSDWLTISWGKVDYLTQLGLKPWYLD